MTSVEPTAISDRGCIQIPATTTTTKTVTTKTITTTTNVTVDVFDVSDASASAGFGSMDKALYGVIAFVILITILIVAVRYNRSHSAKMIISPDIEMAKMGPGTKTNSIELAGVGSSGSDSLVVYVTLNAPLGLGFKPNEQGVMAVTKLAEEGNAILSGQVSLGMEIHSVNGAPTGGLSKAEMVDLIKSNPDGCTLALSTPSAARVFNNPVYGEMAPSGGGETVVDIPLPLGMGFKPNEQGVMAVTKLTEGGNAFLSGQVAIGMVINSVNGSPTGGLSKADMVDLIKSNPDGCTLSLSVPGGGGGGKKKKNKAGGGETLVNIPLPLGMGFKPNEQGVMAVKKLTEGGNAFLSGQVAIGMVINSVNGSPTVGLSKAAMIDLIQSNPDGCTLSLSAPDGKKQTGTLKKQLKGIGKPTTAIINMMFERPPVKMHKIESLSSIRGGMHTEMTEL
jgi:hypothetical protein